MEDIKKKILEKLKKLSEEEKEKREKIQEAKLEGGDSPDNQDYQFNLETLQRIRQEKSTLQNRLEEIEREEHEELDEKRTLKIKSVKKTVSVPIIGREFELLVNDTKKIKIKIVPLYEEIESNEDFYNITTEAPVSKIIEKMIERFIPELERKVEKIVNIENEPDKIAQAIENMNEWVAIQNHSKFTKKLKELSKDKNKLLKELDNFLKQADLDIQKIFKAITNWEFNLKVQGKDIKYKIISAN
ncbi:MAG: hypothetical protein N2169_01515 [bacterium]|nr:hypothetical protein [bacterium]